MSKASTVIGLLAVVLLMQSAAVSALQDPTRPPQYHSSKAQVALTLESILFSDTRRVAVINGKALEEGESLGAARVVSIGKDIVRVQRQGKTYNLTLKRPTIRQEK